MAKFILVNVVSLGTTKFLPGDTIDDVLHPKAAIETAGGVMWPESEPTIVAAAALARTKRLAGASEADLGMIMAAAVMKLGKSEDADHDAQVVRSVTLAIALADITGKGAVTSATFDAATAFPANARLIAIEGNVTTKVQNAGDTDTTTYAAGTDGAGKSALGIAAGTTADAGISGGALGAGRAVGGEKLRVTMTSSVNLSTLSAGAMTVTALYSVPAST